MTDTTDSAPAAPPRPFIMIAAENFDAAPAHQRGPDGEPVGAIVLTLRNPVAAASMVASLEFVDDLIAMLQKLRGSFTGVVTAPAQARGCVGAAGKLFVPGR